MRIYESITWDIETGKILSSRWTEYSGPVALCKGSAGQEQIAAGQQNFYKTLSDNYNTQFAGQDAILSSLNSRLAPTVAAGPSQYGYSSAEDAAQRTQSDSGTAANFQTAKRNIGEGMAAAGGNQFLPTGAQTQANQQLQSQAAQTRSNQQLGITTAGYQQGNQNYNNAVAASQNVANAYNPNGTASNATGAGSSAMTSANTLNSQSNWNVVGGMLGGIASSVAGNINPMSFLGGGGGGARSIGGNAGNQTYQPG